MSPDDGVVLQAEQHRAVVAAQRGPGHRQHGRQRHRRHALGQAVLQGQLRPSRPAPARAAPPSRTRPAAPRRGAAPARSPRARRPGRGRPCSGGREPQGQGSRAPTTGISPSAPAPCCGRLALVWARFLAIVGVSRLRLVCIGASLAVRTTTGKARTPEGRRRAGRRRRSGAPWRSVPASVEPVRRGARRPASVETVVRLAGPALAPGRDRRTSPARTPQSRSSTRRPRSRSR